MMESVPLLISRNPLDGALVDADGFLEGMAFAIAPDEPHVAYALTLEELQPVLTGDLSNTVSTGPCIG